MKKDLNIVVKNVFGEDIFDEKGQPLTARKVVGTALIVPPPNKIQEMSADDKYECWKLASRIELENGVPDLSAQDIVRIKELVGALFLPMVIGPVFELLDA